MRSHGEELSSRDRNDVSKCLRARVVPKDSLEMINHRERGVSYDSQRTHRSAHGTGSIEFEHEIDERFWRFFRD
jgi:hypothetical protein